MFTAAKIRDAVLNIVGKLGYKDVKEKHCEVVEELLSISKPRLIEEGRFSGGK